jgi:hypothetical protein
MDKFPSVRKQEYDLLVRYALDQDETVIEGIVSAFRALGIRPERRKTAIGDVIDAEAVQTLHEMGNRHLRISIRLWGYPVVVTAEDVSIYAHETGTSSS